jgi:carboxypeptidase Q
VKFDSEICGMVWTSSAPETMLSTLCHEIGPRPPGTPGMDAAQQYLMRELSQCDADDVHRERVSILGWRPEEASAEMIIPRRRAYEAIQHVNSAAMAASGHLVDVGAASEERLAKLGSLLEGSVALLRGFETSGAKFTPIPLTIQRLARYGVRGVLMQSVYVEGCPAIELVGFNAVNPTPVVGITAGAARELQQYASSRPTVHLKTFGTAYASECSNVVAEFHSVKRSEETVILSAHLDSFYLNPGAFDNLTGVLTVIELARALASLRSCFTRNLRVVLFTGEEYGFIGSKAYVNEHAAELDSIVFVLNMDSLWPETARGMAVMGSPAMRDHIANCFAEAKRNVDVRDLFCMSSDYLPFFLKGIPAARPADYFNSMPPWSHTTEDTADKIPAEWLRMNAMVYAQLLARILTDPQPLPGGRRSREQVVGSVEGADAVLELQSMGLQVL